MYVYIHIHRERERDIHMCGEDRVVAGPVRAHLRRSPHLSRGPRNGENLVFETGRGKHTKRQAQRQNAKTVKRETAETDGTIICLSIYLSISLSLSLSMYIYIYIYIYIHKPP